MWQKFIQYVNATVGTKVGGYVEAIQATQKVTHHIWEEGKINESLWHSKNEKHQSWPAYMHPAPIVGGAIDGVIDEIIGLPMAR